jgi:hypothetical protein
MNRRALTFVVTALLLGAAASASAAEFKVKLEGTAQDRAKFLERLNENGKDEGLTFVDIDSGYQYRIAVYSEGAKGSDFVFGGGADASAAVLTPDCQVAYIATRGGRGTKGGALNALSKDIVKKLKSMSATK